MQKTIKVKAKTSLFFGSMFKKMDQQITCSKYLIKNTRVFTQEISIKDLKYKILKELKSFVFEPILVKASNISFKKKKKDWQSYG